VELCGEDTATWLYFRREASGSARALKKDEKIVFNDLFADQSCIQPTPDKCVL
jgi:hypothetical protein